jgi:hypothetical protein
MLYYTLEVFNIKISLRLQQFFGCPNKLTSSLIKSCKIFEFFEKSPLSIAEKQPDFQVTSCHHFDTTNANYAYIESE